MLLLTATACTEPALDTTIPRRFEARMVDEAIHRPCGEPKVARRGELRAATCADAELGTLGEHDLSAWLSPAADEIAQADPPGHVARWLPPAADARELRRNISSLESRDEEPTARHLTALGALYHALALATGDARHLVDAYEHTAHALEIAPNSPAALFNRALVASDLGLCHQAREGFRAYLDVDGDSQWAVEARMRRGALPCGPGAAVEETNDDLFEEAIEELLPRWAEAWPKDREAADRLLDEIAELGERLEWEAGDPWVSEVVGELREADARHVEGVRACTEGRALFAVEQYEDHQRAEPRLLAGRTALPESSALLPWCDLWLAGTSIDRGDFDGARRRLLPHSSSARVRTSPLLSGRIAWALGLGALRDGALEEAHDRYAEASQAFAAGDYPVFEGATRMLTGEALLDLGLADESWQPRGRALRALQIRPSYFFLQNALADGARAASGASPRLSRAFLGEALSVAEATEDPIDELEIALTRADFLIEEGSVDQATAEYGRVLDQLETRERRAGVDLRQLLFVRAQTGLWTTGEADHRGQPLPSLDRLVAYYADNGPTWRELHALRIQTRRARADGDDGRVDALFLRAIRRIRETDIDDQTLGFRHWESIQDLFDDALDWTLETRGPSATLDLLEQARHPGRQPPAPLGLSCTETVDGPHMSRYLAPDQTVTLAYGVFAEHLVWWRVAGTDCRFGRARSQPIREALGRLLEQAPSGEVDPALLTTLHQELLARPLEGIAPGHPLILIPDAFLLRVPWAALTDPATGQHLIEGHALALRSAFGDRDPRPLPEAGPRRALIVGDPAFSRDLLPGLDRLPGAADEAREIRQLYENQATVLVHEEATADRVRAELSSIQVLHVASHATTSAAGARELLILASDPETGESGLASSRDLLGNDPPDLDLVVLSACSTLGTEPSRSGGLVGLARPFVAAGARAVVGTLWPVEDRNLRPVVVAFHRGLLDGLSASEALRRAQVTALGTNQSQDPSMSADTVDIGWAALQLVGDLQPLDHPAPIEPGTP